MRFFPFQYGMFPYSTNAIHPRHNLGDQPTQPRPIEDSSPAHQSNQRKHHIMKSIYALATAASLVLLASCDRGPAETVKTPTQAEEIADFCNQIASDFAASPSASTNLYMGRIQRKILEKEWEPDAVAHACSEALRRKTEFIQQHAQAIQNGAQ